MFDYQSLSTRVSEQEFVVERQFASAAALKVAVDIGTSGLGKATAFALGQQYATVILVCRERQEI